MDAAAQKGFDISAALGTSALSVWVPFIEGCRVKIRYISRQKLREISKRCTVTSFDPKTHQKVEDIDRAKWDQELGAEAVEDWDGFMDGGEPYPCTADNIRTLSAKWSVFSKFVGDICVDLEALVAAEKEAERKNLETGSSPEKTTLPSTAKTAEKLKP